MNMIRKGQVRWLTKGGWSASQHDGMASWAPLLTQTFAFALDPVLGQLTLFQKSSEHTAHLDARWIKMTVDTRFHTQGFS